MASKSNVESQAKADIEYANPFWDKTVLKSLRRNLGFHDKLILLIADYQNIQYRTAAEMAGHTCWVQVTTSWLQPQGSAPSATLETDSSMSMVPMLRSSAEKILKSRYGVSAFVKANVPGV